MKRPLFLIAVVWAIGIYLISKGKLFPESKIFSSLQNYPVIRERLMYSESGFIMQSFSGKVKSCSLKGGRTVLTVKGDTFSEYGFVAVYLQNEIYIPEGSSVTFEGSFFLYACALNPGEFDLRKHYDCLNISSAYSAEDIKIVKYGFSPLSELIFKIHQKIEAVIEEYADNDCKGYIKALLFSDYDGEENEIKNLFGAFGLSFIISSSGLQISILGNLIYLLLRKKTRNIRICTGVSFMTMFLYAGLSGFKASLIRGLVVLFVRLSAPVFGRGYDYIDGLSLSLLLLMIFYPKIIFSSGFLYYPALLFGIGILFGNINLYLKKPKGKSMIMLACIQASLLPVKLLTSGKASLYSMPLNSGFMTGLTLILTALIPALLFGFFRIEFLTKFLFGICHMLKESLALLIKAASKLPLSMSINGAPSIFVVFLYFLVLAFIALTFRIRFLKEKKIPEKEEKKHSGYYKTGLFTGLFIIYVFGLIFLKTPGVKKGLAEVCMLSVGQGECILIRTRDKTVMIDCGSTDKENIGENTVIPCLTYLGISKVDILFLTHADDDHTNGVNALLSDPFLSIDRVILSDNPVVKKEFEQLTALLNENKIKTEYISAGTTLSLPDISFTSLSPEYDSYVIGNDSSLVLYLRIFGKGLFFPGDITEKTERTVLQKYRELISGCLFYKAAHHGSKYSSSKSMVEALKPQICFISYGRGNSYGHPHAVAVKRIADTGAQIYKTATSGFLKLILFKDGKNTVQTYTE